MTATRPPGGSVFLVEDEVMIRMMVSDMLEELGYTVAAEAGEIEAKPIERFDPAAVSARGHEIGADVQNLQDLMVAVQSLIIAITSIVNTVATQ